MPRSRHCAVSCCSRRSGGISVGDQDENRAPANGVWHAEGTSQRWAELVMRVQGGPRPPSAGLRDHGLKRCACFSELLRSAAPRALSRSMVEEASGLQGPYTGHREHRGSSSLPRAWVGVCLGVSMLENCCCRAGLWTSPPHLPGNPHAHSFFLPSW